MYFKVKSLACIKGNQYLFRNLSFSLGQGELLLVRGQNGSGKSSLLKILAGLASYEAGTIENDFGLAYISHKEGIKKGLTVLENIAWQLMLSQSCFDKQKAELVIKMFNLASCQNTLCACLSMGQRRKVALVALLLKQKPIWIIDEPFTGLDKASTHALIECFSEHLAKKGMIIIASHTLEGIAPHQEIELSPC